MPAIHDPIHGTIEVSVPELRLIDSWPFQRLRHIKQLGFSELAFPGATHSRYAHSLGAMQMATFMVDHILAGLDLPTPDRERMRQTVRLAVLFHDVGHPPMSHVSERVMPPLSKLNLGEWADDPQRQATHEDYTVKLLIDSELTELLGEHFPDSGITGPRLAGLVMGRTPPGDDAAFRVGKHDLLPLLHQIVSSEMDADRMDYLRRDAYYCGVSYGNYDHVWLTQNLSCAEWEGKLTMALHHKGVWAFENFLLARYHMFLSVYYHHTAICFDHLLGRYYESGAYELPADTESYLKTDDVALMNVLRQSENPWAKAVVRRRAYRLALETHEFGTDAERELIDNRLREAGVDFFRTTSRGVLSKYFAKREKVFPLMVIERERGRFRRIEDYTPLYRRFQEAVAVERIYCKPEHLPTAREILAG